MQVSEVEFIKAITVEAKRQEMQRKLEESEVRRRERIAGIVAKQGELQLRVGARVCDRVRVCVREGALALTRSHVRGWWRAGGREGAAGAAA